MIPTLSIENKYKEAVVKLLNERIANLYLELGRFSNLLHVYCKLTYAYYYESH